MERKRERRGGKEFEESKYEMPMSSDGMSEAGACGNRPVWRTHAAPTKFKWQLRLACGDAQWGEKAQVSEHSQAGHTLTGRRVWGSDQQTGKAFRKGELGEVHLLARSKQHCQLQWWGPGGMSWSHKSSKIVIQRLETEIVRQVNSVPQMRFDWSVRSLKRMSQ